MKVTPIGKKFGKYKVGDEFDLHDKTASALITAKILREVTREVVAESPEISGRTGQPKRTYRRRDLQAES